MSWVEWLGVAVILWTLVGVVLTTYVTSKVLRPDEVTGVQDAIIGETSMTRRHAAVIMGVMGTLMWPITLGVWLVSSRGRPSTTIGVNDAVDDDDGAFYDI